MKYEILYILTCTQRTNFKEIKGKMFIVKLNIM